jgi:outer membrane protein assembly factor BamA
MIYKLCLLFLSLSSLYAFQWEFQGNANFSAKVLKESLGLEGSKDKISASRKSLLVRISLANLKTIYQRQGFFDVRIETKENGETLTFFIFEGTRYSIYSINIEQPKWSPVQIDINALKTKTNQPFEQESILQDMQLISQAFDQRGFIHHELNPKTFADTLQKKITLIFVIEPKLQVRQHSLRIENRRGRSKNALRGLSQKKYLSSLWEYKKNDILDLKGIKDYRKKLLSTGIFTTVSIKDSLVNPKQGLSEIKVHAIEKTPGSIRPSIFLDPFMGLGLGYEASHKNIRGRFHKGIIEGVYAQNRRKITLGYEHPLLFGFILQASDRISILQEGRNVGFSALPKDLTFQDIEERLEIVNKALVTKPINKNFKISFLSDLRYVNVDSSLVKLKFAPIFNMSFLDKPLNPSEGVSVKLIPANGGRLDFSKRYWFFESNLKAYFPLASNLIWAGAFDYGQFFEEGLKDDARLFYQGGYHSLRGHNQRSVFPCNGIDTEGNCLNPSLMPKFYRISQEIRIKLPKSLSLENWQWVSFWDWTQVKDKKQDLKTEYANGIGMGIRYAFDFFTFRFDYTFKTNIGDPYSIEPFRVKSMEFDLAQSF